MLTAKQQDFLDNCNHRWNVKCGATGSGKSFADYSVTIPKRLLNLRGEGIAVMLGNTRGTLERNILDPMRQIWGVDLVGNIRSDNTVKLFGQKVYALGADNKKHVQRIQGASMEYVYGDEVTTWSEGVFEMLKSRLRCPHSVFDGTCNPDNPRHWFKKFLDSDADIFQQKYVIEDGRLKPEIIEELKKEYAGTVFYSRYILGEWVAAEGLVYDGFDESRHVCDEPPPTEGYYYVSSDFGIRNAQTFLLWQRERDTNRWVCLREYYYSGRETKHNKTITELIDGMEDMLDGVQPEKIIIDPSAAAMIAELRKRGYSTRGADNDVINGIADVSTLLQKDRLLICRNCKRTIEEFGLYRWDERKAALGIDDVLKENDHCMDALRYFVKTMKLAKRDGNEQKYVSIWG